MRLGRLFAFALLAVASLGVACGSCQEEAPPSRTLATSEPPPSGVDAALLRAIQEGPARRVHFIVAFERRLAAADRTRLRTLGVELFGRLGDDTYTASLGSQEGLNGLAGLDAFRFAQPLVPEDRISPGLAEGAVPDWALDEAGRLRVVVELFPDVGPEEIAAVLHERSVDAASLGTFSWSVVVDREGLAALSRLDGVRSLSPGPKPFIPLNARARRVTRTETVHGTAVPWSVAGRAVRIGICDGSIDEDHPDFQLVPANTGRFYHSRPDACREPSPECDDPACEEPSPDCLHGTHVASIAAGNGEASAGAGHPALTLRGHAPGAELGDYPYAHAQLALWQSVLVADRTDVTNHSYVQAPQNEYDAEAAELDRLVRGDAVVAGVALPARPQVWGAGNFGSCEVCTAGDWGYYSVVTSSKNTISVGSVDTVDGEETVISDFSSPGPTYDGRIKPDVVAPGACNSLVQGFTYGVQAATAGGRGIHAYHRQFGTSMAAPVVTGIVALMAEAHRASSGEGQPPPLPSTFKAILIQTARDLVKTTPRTECACCKEDVSDECCPETTTGVCVCDFENPDTGTTLVYHAGPDFVTGWGLVNAQDAVAMAKASDHWKEDAVAAEDEADVFCTTVPEGASRLQVTMAWDDAAAETYRSEDAARAKLVNDLDLVLVAPDGTRHLPWTLEPLLADATLEPDPITPATVKPATRGADHRNNVEMVTVAPAMAGNWKAVVSAFQLDAAQRYSLVSSGPVSACPPAPE
jgi:hypothetical protein